MAAKQNEQSKYFYELTPDRILNAFESSTGLRCTGRILGLNSMENRVYEIEVEMDDAPKNPSDRFRVAKFYRPGRWTKDQILEEHEFLLDLVGAEIPVIAPQPFSDGQTLHLLPDTEIFYTVFPKCGGRSPDELSAAQMEQVGRLLARMHNVGAIKTAAHRVKLNPTTYGIDTLRYLLDQKYIPQELAARYQQVVESICQISEPMFARASTQRIHGDCHFGNLIAGATGFFWVDFDDMVVGPPVQDVWLLVPGRDAEGQQQLERLITGYEMMRDFDRTTLRMIEPLRALRFVMFSSWIARRWADPAFPRSFPHFGSQRYWHEQLQDLEEQLQLITAQNRGDDYGGSQPFY